MSDRENMPKTLTSARAAAAAEAAAQRKEIKGMTINIM